MKENRYTQVRAAGKVPVGQMLWEFGTRGMARMMDACDVDFAIIDTEHAAFSSADVADLVAWFSATTIAPFVRVPEIAYHLLARTMDAGALGVMVPNVKTADEARAIVDAVKYGPLGKRGIGLGGALTGYRGVTPSEFLRYSNENTTVICQIESVEGIENLEAIATTPGVDVLWVGHFDLTQSMGIPGQFHDARFVDNLKRVVDVCNRHDLGAGIQPGSIEQAREWMAIGFNVISYGTDMSVYLAAMTDAVAQVRALAAK
ncbi:MAG: aldolase/citrate lyase family protein [Chloroflexota bacterium]|nr:aldolase/citrate lyase family protein [Chloroflexota bacterium]